MCDFCPKFMLQRGNRRTRRVSAISDYLESFRKGKMPGVALCEKRREKGNGRGNERRKRASYGLLEGLETIRQTARDFLQSQHMAD